MICERGIGVTKSYPHTLCFLEFRLALLIEARKESLVDFVEGFIRLS